MTTDNGNPLGHPIFRNKKDNIPTYGAITPQKASPIEEEQPLIIHDSDYPKATTGQRDLLHHIEQEISFSRKATFQILLPSLSLKKVERWRLKIYEVNQDISSSLTPSSFWGGLCWSFFGNSLFFLLVAVIFTVGSLVAIDKLGVISDKDRVWETFLNLSFPMMTAVLGFLGCVRPICVRLFPFTQEVCSFASPSSLQKVVTLGMEESIALVTSRVENVHAKLILELDHLQILFERAARHEFKIRMVDPDLCEKLPTVNPCESLERGIRQSKEDLHKSFLTFQQDVNMDVSSWIPTCLSSPRNLMYHECTKLFISLALFQAFGAYMTCHLLSSYLSTGMEAKLVTGDISYLSAKIPFFASIAGRMSPFTVCWVFSILVEAYLVSSLFLAYVYFVKTSAGRTVSIINDLCQEICAQVNWLLLQNGIFFQCHDLLNVRMSRLKYKLLELVDQGHQISTALSLADVDNMDALSWVSDSYEHGEEEKKVITGFPLASPPADYQFLAAAEKNTPGATSVVSRMTLSIDPPAE